MHKYNIYNIFERKGTTIINEETVEIAEFEIGKPDWNDPNDIIIKNLHICRNAKYLMTWCGHFDLTFLELLPNLECVWLLQIRDQDQKSLKLLKNVKSLIISPYKPYEGEHKLDLNYILDNDLNELTLSSFSIDSDLLRYFKNLENLNLLWCKFNNLKFLKHTPKIESLFINTLPFNSISSIQYLTKLRELKLYNNWSFYNNRIEDFSIIHGLKNLKVLDLHGTEISQREVNLIEKNLPSIRFENLKIKKRFFLF